MIKVCSEEATVPLQDDNYFVSSDGNVIAIEANGHELFEESKILIFVINSRAFDQN